MKKKNKKKSKGPGILLILLFIAGIGVLLYPSISNAWNTFYQKNLISKYEAETNVANEDEYEYEREKAVAYNQTLWPTPNPMNFKFLDEEEPTPEYMDCLNLTGDGMMGYVSIPKINITIPIYHGTDEEQLTKGAGHLEGTSLPVGGENTHSVIAAHRGVPGNVLFTDLDLLEEGDHFTLTVFGEKLCYEVDKITVVEPEDVSKLVIEEGKDLCTLLTCTPYGVNTERLLVRGHRVEYEEEFEKEDENIVLTTQRKMLFIGIAAALFGLIMMITPKKKKRKYITLEEKGNEEN